MNNALMKKIVGKSIVTHLFLGENNSSHLISITLKLKENISKELGYLGKPGDKLKNAQS